MNHQIHKLPVLVIHAHTRCNCRCSMCDIWKTTDASDFTLERLERFLPDIEKLGVESVAFTGGEPLMHANLFQLSRKLRDLGIRVTILSTGLLLERYASQVADEIDEVIVSLDGPEEVHDRIRRTPGSFAAIARGVRALERLESKIPVRARCTLQQMNHDCVEDTVAAARALGLCSLSFLAADTTSESFGRGLVWPEAKQQSVRLNQVQIHRLSAQLEACIDHADGFVVDSPVHLRRIVAHFRGLLGVDAFVAPRCNAPWVSAVLEADGRVRPCFFHAPIGHSEAGLAEILNGERGLMFRQSLDISTNEVCRRCVCSLYRAGPNAQ